MYSRKFLLRNKKRTPDVPQRWFRLEDYYSEVSKKLRVLSMTVRCYYEMVQCLKEDGTCLFLTLTYNDKWLPYVEGYADMHSENPKSFGHIHDTYNNWKHIRQSCWNKSHIQNFFKRLRINLFRSGYDCKIKYLCTCERGKSDLYYDDKGHLRKGTSRPHYHLILFFHGITPFDLENYIKNAWSFYDKKSDTRSYYGNIDNIYLNLKNIAKRTPLGAIQYVCKYVTKGLGSLDIVFPDMDYDYFKYNCCPFCLQSQELGSYYLVSLFDNVYKKFGNCYHFNYKQCLKTVDYLPEDIKDYIISYISRGISLPRASNKQKEDTHVNVPSYFTRKLFKTIINHGLKTRNLIETFSVAFGTSFLAVRECNKVHQPEADSYDLSLSFGFTSCVGNFLEVVTNSLGSLWYERLKKIRYIELDHIIQDFRHEYKFMANTSYSWICPYIEQFSLDWLRLRFLQWYTNDYGIKFDYERLFLDPEDWYLFDTDISNYDDVHLHSFFTLIYHAMVDYMTLKAEVKHYQHEIDFKNNLTKAMHEVPDLFNIIDYA